jgi:hypothetical protein
VNELTAEIDRLRIVNEELRQENGRLGVALVRERAKFVSRETYVAAENRIVALERQIKNHKCGLPASVQEALNSGDGTYRP